MSRRLAATSKRSEKAALLADVLRRLAPEEVAVAVGVLTGAPRQGRIGVGWATLRDVRVEPAGEPSLTVLEVDAALDRAGRDGRAAGSTRPAGRCSSTCSPGRRSRSRTCCEGVRRRAAPGCARRRDGRRRGQGGRRARSPRCAGPTCSPATSASRPHAALTGGVDALAAVGMVPGRAVQPMLASPAPDVAAALDGDRAGVGRVEARRGADPGPPPRRPGAHLHPQPQRDHRSPRRRRRARGRPPGRRPRARRRGARRRRRGRAAPVPGHDGRLRRRRRRRSRARAGGVLLRRAPRRRRAGRRRAAGRAPRAAGVGRPGVGAAAVDRHGRRRRGRRVPRPRRRRRPRGRDGQGARRAVRRRPARRRVAQDQARPHARPRRARRRVGPRPAHRAGCPTCTSAPAATTARS